MILHRAFSRPCGTFRTWTPPESKWLSWSVCFGLYQELIQGEASGLSRLQVDQVDDFLQRSRGELADALTDYRSAVDELKVSLGLPPGTPLVLDQRVLGPFTTAFTSMAAWQRDPNRTLAQLTAVHDRLPRLEDTKIGSRSLHEVIQGTLAEEPFLLRCIEAARTHRAIPRDDHSASDDRNALEFRIRRSIRDLIRIHKNYELDAGGWSSRVEKLASGSSKFSRLPREARRPLPSPRTQRPKPTA